MKDIEMMKKSEGCSIELLEYMNTLLDYSITNISARMMPSYMCIRKLRDNIMNPEYLDRLESTKENTLGV